jgi:hypothetical protein
MTATGDRRSARARTSTLADLGQDSDRDGNDVIIAVATAMVPSSRATCSALARVGLGPATPVPVYLRHQVAELAPPRVALRE